MTPAAIVSKLWNYCNVLRDDGMSYGDYPSTSLRAGSEQLTYLLLLKMADERTKPPYNQPSAVPTKYNWPTLLKKDGDDLFDHYRHMLESFGYNNLQGASPDSCLQNFFGRYHTSAKLKGFVW